MGSNSYLTSYPWIWRREEELLTQFLRFYGSRLAKSYWSKSIMILENALQIHYLSFTGVYWGGRPTAVPHPVVTATHYGGAWRTQKIWNIKLFWHRAFIIQLRSQVRMVVSQKKIHFNFSQLHDLYLFCQRSLRDNILSLVFWSYKLIIHYKQLFMSILFSGTLETFQTNQTRG